MSAAGTTDAGGSGATSTSTSFHLPPRPNAIATLLTTDDFLPGAQTLLYSIKRTLAPISAKEYAPEIIVLVTPNVSSASRSALYPAFCTRLVDVGPIPFPTRKTDSSEGGNSESHVRSWGMNCGLTKLNIFTLEVYDTLLYIDSDCLVLKDVSHLLDLGKRESRRGLIAAAPDIFPPDKFNAGVLVIRPSTSIFEDMMKQSSSIVSFDGGDTGFLNAYFSGWFQDLPSYARLPFGYNAQRFMYVCTHEKQPKYWDIGVGDKLTIVHFSSSPKPWETMRAGRIELAEEKELTQSHLDDADKQKIIESRKAKSELEKMWETSYKRSQDYAVKFHKEKNKKERQKQSSVSNTKSSHGDAMGAGRQAVHKLVARRYKELRKNGMNVKDAMREARAHYGADKNDDLDPGSKVASMFGMAI